MSDTPETDHLENELGQAARMSHPILWAQSRKLERERDEARGERDALRDAVNALHDYVYGKRNDDKDISEILNGAMKI